MFTQLPTNTTAPVTGSSSFTCQVSGDPAPTISWYRNQTLITGEAIIIELYMRQKNNLNLHKSALNCACGCQLRNVAQE